MDLADGDIPDYDPLRRFIGCNPGPDILSCHHLHIFEIVNIVFLSNIIAMFGVVANIINIKIFFKHGFATAVNVSFFSLAISDMCCQIGLLWACMCLNPFIMAAGVPWLPIDFMDLPGGWIHAISGRITSYITVFITAERCLSIITPLKVKQIITPKRAIVVMALIYIINIVTIIPEYATSYLEFKFFPEKNATLIAITFRSNWDEATLSVYFMGSISSALTSLAVIIWTVILVVKLQQSSKWRQQASSDRDRITSSRDKKTVKMVAMIATVLIVCYTPSTILFMATFIEPELNTGKRYVNLWIAVCTIVVVFSSANASVNIFFYYRMSSKYRQTFDDLFKLIFHKETRITTKRNI